MKRVPPPAPLLLRALVPFYRAGLAFDRRFRTLRARSLPTPVVSIGNITLGGTGKTPLLFCLIEELLKRGRTPCVLTRGYRGGLCSSHAEEVIQGASAAAEASDEIRLLAERFPELLIGAGANRRRTASMIQEKGPVDLFLLDDGFQHWPIRRNFDIVCVDVTDPWGRGIVPAGRAREPRSALKRAQAIVLTRTELVPPEAVQKIEDDVRNLAPGAAVVLSRFVTELVHADTGKPVVDDPPRRQRLVAASGIGNPTSFETFVASRGEMVRSLRFSDHRDFSEKDVSRIAEVARSSDAVVVVTEKDWVKLSQTSLRFVARVWVARIQPAFQGENQQAWSTLCDRIAALQR